ncbi:MAG: TIGR03089 family protein [Nocardioides sp.]
MTTFASILQAALRVEPGRPLVTYYDLTTAERTELSVTTYANWVAKVASLLAEEFDIERGGRVLIDLPASWLGPVALGAAWTVGAEVVWDGDADLAICGPGSMQARSFEGRPVLASALHPLGLRFAPGALPDGVRDLGVEVWSQPDAFIPWDPPEPDDLAVSGLTHEEVWEAATAATELEGSGLVRGGRLFTGANPASPSGLATFTAPLALGGSAVWVSGGDVAARRHTYDVERATSSWPVEAE